MQGSNISMSSFTHSNLRYALVIQVLRTAIHFVKTQLEKEGKILTKMQNSKSHHLDQFTIKIILIATNSNFRKNERCTCLNLFLFLKKLTAK